MRSISWASEYSSISWTGRPTSTAAATDSPARSASLTSSSTVSSPLLDQRLGRELDGGVVPDGVDDEEHVQPGAVVPREVDSVAGRVLGLDLNVVGRRIGLEGRRSGREEQLDDDGPQPVEEPALPGRPVAHRDLGYVVPVRYHEDVLEHHGLRTVRTDIGGTRGPGPE